MGTCAIDKAKGGAESSAHFVRDRRRALPAFLKVFCVMADIFISYAKSDRAPADELSQRLLRKGFTVWFDKSLGPGHNWRQKIKSEIEQARALIVIWSASSVQSTFVMAEVDAALKIEKPVITLVEPEFNVDDIPLGFGHIQTALISDDKALAAMLAESGVAPAPRPAPAAPVERTAHDIFTVPQPGITLIDRTQTVEGQRMAEVLKLKGRCIRLCGPTRSGKTIFINQILSQRHPLYLSGGVIQEIEAFHDHLAVQLDPPMDGRPSEAQVFMRVTASGRPIVIDDYHRIPTGTRKAILARAQAYLDKGISLILVSWTDIDGARIQADSGLDGRSEPPIYMSLWRSSDIIKIGRIGFAEGLNVTLDPFTLAAITRQSFCNPSLMQQHCYKVAQVCGVLERQATRRQIGITNTQAIELFKGACAQTHKNLAAWIERGTDASIALKTGKATSVYGLILLAVMDMEPIHMMSMARLAKNMRERAVDGSTINEYNAENAVRDFIARLAHNPHRHTALDFVELERKLHIHPFFKRYLLWDFAPSKGYGYPNLTKYKDEKATAA